MRQGGAAADLTGAEVYYPAAMQETEGAVDAQCMVSWDDKSISTRAFTIRVEPVIIGGTALKGGVGRVWGTVVGVLILSLIDNILNLANLVSPYLNGAIQGVIIVLAVVLQRDKRAADER